MPLINIFLIAIALSFDAMAVAACNGAHHHQMKSKKALKIAFFFGFFQFLMPLIGYLFGLGLEKIISNFDHWIAFLILTTLGVKLLIESFKKHQQQKTDIHSLKILLAQAIATSIDALIIGVTFALLPVNIWQAVLIIGLTTFSLSLISIYIGKKFGEKWGKKTEIIGSIVLILIGIKILLEHLL